MLPDDLIVIYAVPAPESSNEPTAASIFIIADRHAKISRVRACTLGEPQARTSASTLDMERSLRIHRSNTYAGVVNSHIRSAAGQIESLSRSTRAEYDVACSRSGKPLVSISGYAPIRLG